MHIYIGSQTELLTHGDMSNPTYLQSHSLNTTYTHTQNQTHRTPLVHKHVLKWRIEYHKVIYIYMYNWWSRTTDSMYHCFTNCSNLSISLKSDFFQNICNRKCVQNDQKVFASLPFFIVLLLQFLSLTRSFAPYFLFHLAYFISIRHFLLHIIWHGNLAACYWMWVCLILSKVFKFIISSTSIELNTKL